MRSVAIVGTGLIGTSVALALRAHGVEVHLIDRDGEAAAMAESLGAGVAMLPSRPVDLAVLAIPPSQIADALYEYQGRGLAHCFTDVGSVKEPVHVRAKALGCDLVRYVGGHPMAGRELSGPTAARADLFEGRVWVLTPCEASGAAAVGRTLDLVSLCGARPVIMNQGDHDRAVALTSHVPRLVAAVLAARLRDAPEATLDLCGQGIRDTTRIAGGDAALYGDILCANAAAVAAVLADVAADLSSATAALRALPGADPRRRKMAAAVLEDVLMRGVAGRAAIPGHPAPLPVAVAVVGRCSDDLPAQRSRSCSAERTR